MTNKNITLLLIACLMGVSGCAQYWYQEDVSYRQCLRDREDCFQELQKRTSFTYTGKYEFEYMTQCMQEKGYRLVTEKELPMDVRRSEPNSTLHWRAKGISGTLGKP